MDATGIKELTYKYFVVAHLSEQDHVQFFKTLKDAEQMTESLTFMDVDWSLCEVAKDSDKAVKIAGSLN